MPSFQPPTFRFASTTKNHQLLRKDLQHTPKTTTNQQRRHRIKKRSRNRAAASTRAVAIRTAWALRPLQFTFRRRWSAPCASKWEPPHYPKKNTHNPTQTNTTKKKPTKQRAS